MTKFCFPSFYITTHPGGRLFPATTKADVICLIQPTQNVLLPFEMVYYGDLSLPKKIPFFELLQDIA